VGLALKRSVHFCIEVQNAGEQGGVGRLAAEQERKVA
jgi:hypothetical protein